MNDTRTSITNRRFHSLPRLRRAARVLCVLFVASFLLSSAYLVFHAGHSHDRSAPGGSCATCAHMAAAASFGKLLSLAVVGTFIAFRPLSAVPAPLPALLSRTVRTSPVRLKVRLDY